LHFPEAARKSKTAAEYIQLKEEGYTLSTSIHNADEDVDNLFDYAFYGPVFDSISKKGYRSALAENTKIKSHKSKQIAIGGVDGNNCTKAFEMGFAGVAVLGAIWQSPEPINEFIKIQSKCNSIAQL
jgi:thiamine-phosphate pyrophosphorylase